MWTTVEEEIALSSHVEKFRKRAVVVDCLTLWLTNFFAREGAFSNVSREPQCEENGDGGTTNAEGTGSGDEAVAERALEQAKAEFDSLTKPYDVTYFFVTNELGSGTHGKTIMSRKFVDAQGWLNQYVAARADSVIHMVCGIPNTIKELPDQVHSGEPLSICSDPVKRKEAKMLDKFLSARKIRMDDNGYFLVKVDGAKGVIVASFHSCILNDKGEVCDLQGNKIPCRGTTNRPEPMKVWECRTAKELTAEIFERWEAGAELVSAGHAAYIGREAQKAEDCLYSGRPFQQD